MIKKAIIFSLIGEGIYRVLGVLFPYPFSAVGLLLIFIPYLVLDYIFYRSLIRGKSLFLAIALTEILYYFFSLYMFDLGLWIGTQLYQVDNSKLSSQHTSSFINESILTVLYVVTRVSIYWGTVKLVADKTSKRVT